MKKSQILREAYKLIESEEERYVCWAIERISDNCIYARNNSEKLLDRIKRKFRKDGLHSVSSVESWLHTVHGVPFKDMTDDSLREYRLAWLDNWASELEAKGE